MKILALISKVAGFVLSVGSYADFLPPKYGPIGLIVFGSASILKDTVNRIGDFLDNRKIDGSFNP
jgi:hypothetical protein